MTRLSWTGRHWSRRPVDEALAQALAASLGLPLLAARCLQPRLGLRTPEEWLEPTLEHLHDPNLMLGMERAVARIRQAVDAGERVRIVTDYDVDGTTSSLILQRTLWMLGAKDKVDYHIPDRFDEGYGFSERAAQRAVADGVGLLITADIGVRDHGAVSIAQQGGTDVIVCDHHLPEGEGVPEAAHAVLCPPQPGCDYPNPALAACGVSLKLAQALLADNPKAQRFVDSALKLAAIGTVADVVDLSTPENRAIVSLGLQSLRRGPHAPALAALLEVSGLEPGNLQASDLGFRLGPRINAAGRLTAASEIIELFATRDPATARRRAQELDQLNRQRQGIQRRLVERCTADLPDPPPGFLVRWGEESDGWHRGVVGIVAARVRDTIHRPAAIVSVSGTQARGSVRSVAGVHAVKALDSAADLLDRYGGHPAAAGFSIAADRLPALAERLAAWVEDHHEDESLVPQVRVDAVATPGELDWDAVKGLASIGPFGKGNPSPRIELQGIEARSPRLFGTNHLRFQVGGLEAVWWRAAERLQALGPGPIDLVGQLEVNSWKGRDSLRFTVEDARDAS